MKRQRARSAVFVVSLVVLSFGLGGTASADVDDGNGHEWRQLTETTLLSWNQVAALCPRDGQTPCSGAVGGKDLTGWVWATGAQVIAFMGIYEPDLLTANPPAVSGPEYLGSASIFLDEAMHPTLSISGYPFFSESTSGWTASVGARRIPIEGRVGYGSPPPGGAFQVLPAGTATEISAHRGVWLWRPAGLDHSPPVISSSVDGTAGTNGWYVSDVSVTWGIVDAESPVTSTVGCEPAAVTADTSAATFSCQATSSGGTAQASVNVQRDATPPVVTCGSPAPVLSLGQIGAEIAASVTDATSGPTAATARAFVNATAVGSFTAPVTGFDRAGNQMTANCPYTVVVPPCLGLTPTLVGTPGNDVINGTASQDVIQALSGNDTVYGKDGTDVMCGGPGADMLDGGIGNDTTVGDDGPDTTYGGPGKDISDGGSSDDSLNGGGGDDFLDGGANNDSIRGDEGHDTCTSGEIRMSSCEIILP